MLVPVGDLACPAVVNIYFPFVDMTVLSADSAPKKQKRTGSATGTKPEGALSKMHTHADRFKTQGGAGTHTPTVLCSRCA